MIVVTEGDKNIKGTIDENQNVAGSWTWTDLSGTFGNQAAENQTAASDESDGGGKGGCFISTLLADDDSSMVFQ